MQDLIDEAWSSLKALPKILRLLSKGYAPAKNMLVKEVEYLGELYSQLLEKIDEMRLAIIREKGDSLKRAFKFSRALSKLAVAQSRANEMCLEFMRNVDDSLFVEFFAKELSKLIQLTSKMMEEARSLGELAEEVLSSSTK